MEDHVPRHAQMGAWVLINDRWYEGFDTADMKDAKALLDELKYTADDRRQVFDYKLPYIVKKLTSWRQRFL